MPYNYKIRRIICEKLTITEAGEVLPELVEHVTLTILEEEQDKTLAEYVEIADKLILQEFGSLWPDEVAVTVHQVKTMKETKFIMHYGKDKDHDPE